ncbi:P-loop ATPase, Sll1717 family [Cryobacterium sp. N21]|uniref:P-loop ATPase, Sll1717 family n=1 Tax=Cryobacterium sp. N21 TaxID=2048289 RepID=UPI001124D0E8|nr:hypothetical protein [Cryobacterium sp. N21]
MSKKVRLGSGFNIGGDQAEADPILDEAFYSSGQYATLADRLDTRCFIVGRTGSGKSAALKRLMEDHPEKVIRIVPEDLSLPYITNLDVVKKLQALDVDLQSFWKALWRHVFIVEVIRHRYKIDNADSKSTVLQTLREKVARNPGKKLALAYLDEFEGKFWAETDERVREITSTLTKKIEGDAEMRAGLPGIGSGAGSTSGSVEMSESDRRELGQRYQRIINETQLARLNKMMDVLDEDVLGSTQDFTYIVIDDLDKDWVDAVLTNDLIMALFKTVHDLKRVRNLKVLVALRTNIFEHLDFGSASGGQEEKYRSLVLPMNWTRQQLESLIDERTRVASRYQKADTVSFRGILPNQNAKRGSALTYLLDRTLLRPRDLISFVRECLLQSEGKSQISWDAIKQAEIVYSENRLLALRDEWKINYPGIDRAFETFRHASGRMNREEIERRLDDCILLLAEDGFTGKGWLEPLGAAVLSGHSKQSWAARYGPILKMLYSIGFLGVASQGRRNPTFYIEEPNSLKFERQIDLVESYFVARAYHSALEVKVSD